MSTIEDKYLEAEKRLNDYVRQPNTDVIPTLEKMEGNSKADAKEENDYVEIVINNINDFRRDVIQYFNKSCDILITEVKTLSSKCTEVLKGIDTSKKIIESLIREINENIKRGELDIINYKTPNLESLVPKLKSPQNFVPIFEPAIKILEVIQESVGKIKFEQMNREEKEKCLTLRYLHVQKLNSFSSESDVTSMTSAGYNTTWVMNCDSPTICLYNNKGEVVRSVTVKGSTAINGKAITKSREMIVTCIDQKVRHISMSGRVSTLTDTAPFGCYGVCVTVKDEILVCMRGQGFMNHVAVFSLDGFNRLRVIRGRDGQGKHLITDPYRVVQNGEDLCMVHYNKNMVCVDERDNVRWVYDGEQAKLGMVFDPRGICVDKHKNLLVTDTKNHCVHYIDRDGGLIQVILTREQTGFICHWAICVDDSTGQVWVGNVKEVVIDRYLK